MVKRKCFGNCQVILSNDNGEIKKTEKTYFSFTIGEQYKKDRVIEVVLPFKKNGLNISIYIDPYRLANVIRNGELELVESGERL